MRTAWLNSTSACVGAEGPVTIAYVWRVFRRYSATVQEMFKGENAEAFPILEDIALVDEAFKSKPSGTKQKQEL